jgi:hypothetical protein
VQKDGNTYRQHLEAVAGRFEIYRRKLAGPGLPQEMAYLWDGFLELHFARRSDTMPQPIAWSEIEAWARLTGRVLRAWEVDILRALDNAWLTTPKFDEDDGI